MEAPRTLVLLPYSPWSERARWALDHHRLAYQTIVHAPVIGERRLRKLVAGRVRPATVPVLIEGETVLTDSWDIAAHADRVGAGPALLGEGRVEEAKRWAGVCDAAMGGGRALVVAGLLRTPAALDESMPPAVPRWIRVLSRPVNRWGTGWFGRKYGVSLAGVADHEATLRAGLAAVRAGLAGADYLLGGFTYADIAAATLLQGVSPVADRYIPMGPATRTVWTQPGLAAEFADLLAWRDEIYSRHRIGV